MIIGDGEVAEEMPLVTTDAGQSFPDDPFHIVTAEELSKPLPPLEYVIDGFLPKGSITLLAGYSASYKTWLGIAMALAVAGGGTFLGHAAKLAWTLYLNYEHPKTDFFSRSQQLARGFSWPIVPPGFEVGDFPEIGLDSDRFVPSLEVVNGVKPRGLVVVDSLRAALRSVDENSSDARRFVDDVRRISEARGTSFLLVAHARKGRQTSTRGGDLREIVRGSSAFLDAVDNAFVVQRDDTAGGVRLSHVKCRFGAEMEDQLLVLESDPGGNAVRLVSLPCAASTTTDDAKLRQEVSDFVKTNPRCNQRAVRTGVGQQGTRVTTVLHELSAAGLIANKGTDTRHSYFWIGPDP